MGGMAAGGNRHDYNARWNWRCFFCCLSASAGGALFGYDNGVMGGVVSDNGFLKKFLPNVLAGESNTETTLYCTYNNNILQFLTSSLFLAGTICEISGTTAYLNRYHGRKRVMSYSGALFMLAAVLLCAAENISMIFIGRVFQGIAISFASVSVPIYNSEMAPPQHRGLLNQLYQIILTLWIFIAELINLIVYVTGAQRWGWRLSLGFAFVPSFALFLGGVFLPDSPVSLLERGHPEQARRNLERVRGTKDVDKEFSDMTEAAQLGAACKHPWKNMFSKKYRPMLFLSGFSTLFQQWTGINILIFYAPEIFLAFGATKTISLVCALILVACNHLSTYVAFWTADHVGRRPLFLQAGVQMFIALLAIALCLKLINNPKHGLWEGWLILGLTCLFDMAYAWSWGPLGWLYPTEVNPLETRSTGLAVASCMNLLFSFVISQCFLSMLCALQWATFLFFACCVLVMTTIVYFFFIETKGVPLEEAPFAFRRHWFWKHYARSGIGFEEKLIIERRMRYAAENGIPFRCPEGLEDVQGEVELEMKNYGRLLTPADMDKGGNVLTDGKGQLLEENNINENPLRGQPTGKFGGAVVGGENSSPAANANPKEV